VLNSFNEKLHKRQRRTFRRIAPTSPRSPIPASAKDDGSGTATGGLLGVLPSPLLLRVSFTWWNTGCGDEIRTDCREPVEKSPLEV
jgi:hypothetical protein